MRSFVSLIFQKPYSTINRQQVLHSSSSLPHAITGMQGCDSVRCQGRRKFVGYAFKTLSASYSQLANKAGAVTEINMTFKKAHFRAL